MSELTTTVPVDVVEAYISEVRTRLADVPEEDRVELLDDVAAHVREIAEEFGPAELETRLGTPAEFTHELRVSAGYAPASEPAGAAASPGRLRRSFAWARAKVDTEPNRVLWRRLQPGWFVLRGVFVGYLLLAIAGADAGLIPRVGDTRLFGFAVLVACAIASYKLAERRPAVQAPWVRRARIGAEVALVLFALAYIDDTERVVYYESGPSSFERDPCLRDASGSPIGNLYAFDPAGQLIPQFFLTDQAGRPINNLCPEMVTKEGLPVETVYARDVNGSPVYGVFPRAQTAVNLDAETGTTTKAPVVPPAVVLPQLAPPTTAAPATEQPPAP